MHSQYSRRKVPAVLDCEPNSRARQAVRMITRLGQPKSSTCQAERNSGARWAREGTDPWLPLLPSPAELSGACDRPLGDRVFPPSQAHDHNNRPYRSPPSSTAGPGRIRPPGTSRCWGSDEEQCSNAHLTSLSGLGFDGCQQHLVTSKTEAPTFSSWCSPDIAVTDPTCYRRDVRGTP